MPPIRPLGGPVIAPAPRNLGPASPGAPATPVSNPSTVSTFTTGRPAVGATELANLRALVNGHTSRTDERRIIESMRGMSAGALNVVLGSLSVKELHELIGDIDDRLVGPDNHTNFLNLLSKERLPELTVDSRAKLVHALQHHRTSGADETAIRDVFLGTKGAALTALKNAIDQGGDYRDLQQLVFHDIDDAGVKAALLRHFKTEAATSSGQVKVLSDIDDTFYANLKDSRYPMKTVYPGVRALYLELDKGGAATPDRVGDLMFLSARPYDRPGLGETHTRNTLDDKGVRPATVLSGDWAHLIGNENIAAKKYDNWSQLRQLYPEYGSVFLGDSGQGDAIFGAAAAATPGGEMKRVFIHNVTELTDAQRADFAAKGVTVFDTYVGAAIEAFKAGLITREGLERVATSAQRELNEISFSQPAQKAARQAELERDLAAMRALP